MEHVMVFGSTSGSVRSTSPNIQTTQPILSLQQSQATAFVQPTQQQTSQEPTTTIMEAVHSSQMERPSTSTAVFGTGTKNHEEIVTKFTLIHVYSHTCSQSFLIYLIQQKTILSQVTFWLSSEIMLTSQIDNKRPICILGENGNRDIIKTPMGYFSLTPPSPALPLLI